MDFAPSPRKRSSTRSERLAGFWSPEEHPGSGAALAAAFLARGDDVLDRGHQRARSCRADAWPIPPPRQPHFIKLDVRSDDDWAAARDWVEREWGGLDVLVNNAGVAGGGRIDVAGMDEWQWITEINLFGVVRGTRTFVPMFKQQRSGHIVNIASLAGLVHPAGMGSYNAVKAGVVAFSETSRARARGVGRALLGGVPLLLPHQPDREHAGAAPAGGDTAVGQIDRRPGRRRSARP